VRSVTSPKGPADDFSQALERQVLVLFAMVIETLGWATASLLDQDLELADRLISNDSSMDRRCMEITEAIKSRIAEANLDPDELEELIGVLQMVPELERSADLAEHIAQRTKQELGAKMSPRCRGIIQAMSDAGIKMWQLSSRAFAERSRELTFDINEADDELDNLSAALLSEGAAGGVDPAVAAELALLARFYERLGDHAVNLARRSASLGPLRKPRPASMPAWQELARRLFGVLRRLSSKANSARRLGGIAEAPFEPVGSPQAASVLAAAARNARLAVEELQALVASAFEVAEVRQRVEAIAELEAEGDRLTRRFKELLEQKVVGQHLQAGVHALAEEIDDVVDDVFAAAELMMLIELSEPLPEIRQQVANLAEMASEMEALISVISSGAGARRRLERIVALEREADGVYRRCLARLFGGELEPLEVIKWKDVAAALEEAANRVEDVADAVEDLLVRSSGASRLP